MTEPYQVPPYPYDRLDTFKVHGEAFDGGLINLSIGAPHDPAPETVVAAMMGTGSEVGYPPSAGTPELRGAAQDWLARRFGIELPAGQLAACVGSKEFVVSLPQYLHLRSPNRDTVLYPAVSYPSYAMGAELHGLRAVAVPVDENWRMVLDGVDADDITRALCLWVCSPGNPAGACEDLEAAARWGRAHGVPVISDECYIEFTWKSPFGPRSGGSALGGRSILEFGHEGVLALHSLSKRNNFAGGRVGVYAGDSSLVYFLSEVRKHSGMLIPGPLQAAGTKAFLDDDHVALQRERYKERMDVAAGALRDAGLDVPMPDGGFYLWVAAPNGDSWALAEELAKRAGILVSPGEFYGEAGNGHVRVAVVSPVERLALIGRRLNGHRFD